MSDKILSLKPVNSEPDPRCIKILEAMLERAKSGNIHSVAIVTLNEGRVVATNFSCVDFIELLGAIEYLRTLVMKEFIDSRSHEDD